MQIRLKTEDLSSLQVEDASGNTEMNQAMRQQEGAACTARAFVQELPGRRSPRLRPGRQKGAGPRWSTDSPPTTAADLQRRVRCPLLRRRGFGDSRGPLSGKKAGLKEGDAGDPVNPRKHAMTPC